jgi:hypothetical protein
MKEYKYEDLFSIDPDDPENVILTIPPEIMEAKGWHEGTRIHLSVGDRGSLIITDLDELEKKEKNE